MCKSHKQGHEDPPCIAQQGTDSPCLSPVGSFGSQADTMKHVGSKVVAQVLG